MALPTLPPSWTEEKDQEGQVFYVNHAERVTTWERPTESSSKLPPPLYSAVESKRMFPAGITCTGRLAFWITAGMSWVVWMFSISAVSGDKWLEDIPYDHVEFAAASDYWLEWCNNRNDYLSTSASEGDYADLCDRYKAFTGMQIIATILCSVAVVVLTAAFFRPARKNCCSVLVLGGVGAVLMLLSSLFQLLACIIVVVIEKEDFDPEFDYIVDEGDTFAVGVVGCVLAMLSSVLLFMYSARSGDGPFFQKTASGDNGVQGQEGHHPQGHVKGSVAPDSALPS